MTDGFFFGAFYCVFCAIFPSSMSVQSAKLATGLRLLCLAIMVSACERQVYGPNFQHNPIFENQGEWQLSGSRGGTPGLKFLEITAAHALYSDVGLMLHAQYAYDDLISGEPMGYAIEPAVGIFSQKNSWLSYSLYASYGIGKRVNLRGSNFSEIYWSRYALQPAAQIDLDGLYLTFSARLGMISLDQDFTTFLYENAYTTSYLTITTDREFILIEPAITFSHNWRAFQLSLQYVHQLPAYAHGAFSRYYFGGSLAWRITPANSRK